jgi:hypothetical protein|tara:strand:- start:131 stop:475 length:345 start_codon:yes stop_codon:yes gene_type:complete
MSFNEDELRKIENATSGWFKKSARAAISQAISALRPKIENVKQMQDEQRQDGLKQLVYEATEARHKALQTGANSHGHSEWAAAAVCESWLHELVGGTEDSIARVEAAIDRLERR